MRLLRKPILIRSFAVFFCLEMVLNICLPGVSWALTEGPTAPEASSFEPVDTSEMVNLTSGDLTYNLPLLEVPGPGGSYPVTLAYHAGIVPSEDASWVGLGWNINTGSILRSASGYPDDWKNVTTQTNESWVGGRTDRVTMGLSASWWSVTLSGGIIKTQDTYKGSGLGGYTGASYGWGAGDSGFGVSGGVGVSNDPVGGSGISVGSGFGYSTDNVGVSLGTNSSFSMGGSSSSVSGGISANYNHATANGGRKGGGVSVLGASISSSGNVSVSVAGVGVSAGHLNTSGKVTSQTTSNLSEFQQSALHIVSPVFSYSDDVTKYYISEQQSTYTSGALYPVPAANENFDTHDYDVYDMFEVADGSANPASGINRPQFGLGNEIMMGGTLPATDNYMVMGQGTGGGIKPYDMLGTLYRQSKKNKDLNYITRQYTGSKGALPQNQVLPEFMFLNEFSNRFMYDNTGSGEYFGSNPTPLQVNFNPDKVTSAPEFTGDKTTKNKLGRASDVEWYSNQEILSGSGLGGLLLPNAKGFERSYDNQIGALKITNPSGVTYHYALPAYTSDETYHTENIAHDLAKDGDFKTIVKRQAKYAYTWYLTAVTGPDYVDRGTPGLSQDDWGYWIEFEYGKWASNYKWRTPETGFVDDLDGNFRNYSSGTKELYYLNAIRSATHTALFIKDVRRDGKGLATNGRDASFSATPCGNYPTSTLRLSKIILIENDHLPAIDYSYNNSYGPIVCQRQTYDEQGEPIWEDYDINVHYGANVLLTENITHPQHNALEANSVKRIVLNTDDTQMMPNTTNSFSSPSLYTSMPINSTQRFGKLELKSIKIYGRGSQSVLPPITFDYKNKTTPYSKDKVDTWGFYKSDYNANIKDVNLRKMTSNASAQEVDTWSLNKIVTSLGAEIHIDYESDDYVKSVLHNKVNFKINSFTSQGDGKYTVYMNELTGQLSTHFKIGQIVKSMAVVSEARSQTLRFFKEIHIPLLPPIIIPDGCAPVTYFKLTKVDPYVNDAKVIGIGTNYLTLEVTTGTPTQKVPDETNSGLSVGEFLSNVSPEVAVTATDCNPDLGGGWYCKPFEARTETFRDFIGGEIIAEIKEEQKGGGLRVKEIQVLDELSTLTYATSYDYRDPATGKSSGVTTYVPFKTNSFVLDYPERYKDAIEGYFSQGNNASTETMCTGGPIANLITNWEEIANTVLRGPTLEYLLDYYDLITYQNRPTMAAFLGTSLSTRNDVAEYKRTELMSELMSKINEAPSAGVMYEFVKVSNKVIENGVTALNPSYTLKQFIVYDESMVSIKTSHPKSTSTFAFNNADFNVLYKRGITINNYGNAVGQPKSSKLFATDGTLLSETTYHYLHEIDNSSSDVLDNYMSKLLPYNSQGVVDETFVNARYIPYERYLQDVEDENDDIVRKEFYRQNLVGVMTRRRNLPVVMVAEESRNYKTGVSSIVTNTAFDFYSGTVTKSLSRDGYGNTFLSEMIPAYRKYPGMGLSIDGGKHMLSQQAATFSYKVDPANASTKIGVVSGSVQTWSDQIGALKPGGSVSQPEVQAGIWRMHSNYVFVGEDNVPLREDGFYPLPGNTLPEFTAWTDVPGDEVTPAGWQKGNEITLFDVNSHAVEAKDLNNIFAATRMTFDQSRVIATASNSEYKEFIYSGAEEVASASDQTGSGLYYGAGGFTTSAHTGAQAVVAAASGIEKRGFTYSFAPKMKTYHVSVWSSQPQAKIKYKFDEESSEHDALATKIGEAGGWNLLEADITLLEGHDKLEIWCESDGVVTNFDDFRVHPHDATMMSYVYNKWGELTHILGNNNLFTEYHYDAMGRLDATYRETFEPVKRQTSKTEYHYGNE